jgi:unsaturated chondroitin disaccharide hydrolase
MGNSAYEAVPLRIVVRFRPVLEQSFARALRPDTDALALATAYSALSFLARVNPTGQIDAYNGTGYVAITINYSAGVTDHFRMGVNVFARPYSVDVTPVGGSELTVGLNDAFRTAPTRLYTWNLDAGSTPVNCVLTANNLNS